MKNRTKGGRKLKILIFTSKFGMGHYRAAEALAEAIQHARPEDKILLCDFTELLFGRHRAEVIYGAYRKFVAHGSRIYNHIYRTCTGSTAKETRRGHSALLLPIRRILEESGADVILSSYSGCNGLIGDCLRRYHLSIPFITCITDIGIHGKWIDPAIDLYLAASEETRRQLLLLGIDHRKIAVTGIPVRQSFLTSVKEQKTIRNAGRSASSAKETRLLIMGGGLGLLPSGEGFYDCLEAVPALKTTVITGRNKQLLRRLSGRYRNVRFLPFTENISALFAESDWLFTKPGGITIFEAIHACTPMILEPAFLQQEKANGEFVRQSGAGILLPSAIEKNPELLVAVLQDSSEQQRIAENMAAMQSHLDTGALIRFLGRTAFETERRTSHASYFRAVL